MTIKAEPIQLLGIDLVHEGWTDIGRIQELMRKWGIEGKVSEVLSRLMQFGFLSVAKVQEQARLIVSPGQQPVDQCQYRVCHVHWFDRMDALERLVAEIVMNRFGAEGHTPEDDRLSQGDLGRLADCLFPQGPRVARDRGD